MFRAPSTDGLVFCTGNWICGHASSRLFAEFQNVQEAHEPQLPVLFSNKRPLSTKNQTTSTIAESVRDK